MAPYIMRVCEAFARQGINVELWVPRRYNPKFKGISPFEYHAIEKNFLIKEIPIFDGTSMPFGKIGFFVMLASFTLSLFFKVLFMSNRKDVIFYFHDLRDAWATVLLSKNVFSEIHMYYRSSFSPLNHWCFRTMRGFLVATGAVLEEIRNEYGVDSLSMMHAPCAVNSDRFAIDTSRKEARKKLGLPGDKRIILYAGHLFPEKGVDTLLDVARHIFSDEAVYIVGGTDEDIRRFKQKAKSDTLRSRAVIIGRRPHREIPLWLRAADILVIPNSAKYPASKFESSPSKLFEYMASGRPIVASDVPAIRDTFNESMGYFFEPDNVVSLVRVIHQACSDPEKEEKGRQAREAARAYDWDTRALLIKQFIETRIA